MIYADTSFLASACGLDAYPPTARQFIESTGAGDQSKTQSLAPLTGEEKSLLKQGGGGWPGPPVGRRTRCG
jgi:hypothetical protein